MQQALMQDNTRLQDLVADIEQRYDCILHLETQVLNLQDLMRDLAFLVDEQSSTIERTAENVATAGTHVANAHAELKKAEEYQRKAQRCRCWLLVIVLGCLCVITVPVVLHALKFF
jgi:t-SNARE complex subunit (syntaxin)